MTALRQLVLWLLALALMLAPLVAVFNGWIASERWPLQRLVIEAEFRQIDELQVRDVVLPHLNRGFFAVRPEQIRQALMTLPWVRQAEVRKRWPGVLELRLVEHRAYARWGEDRLLSRAGVLFAAGQSSATGQLPLLQGPDDRLVEVVRVYRKSVSLLSASGLSVRAVRLSPRGSWSLRLDDGSELLLGRAEVEARLERYSKVLPQLREPPALPILRADLRYANGFALLWAKPGIGIRESGLGRSKNSGSAKDAKDAKKSRFDCFYFASFASFADNSFEFGQVPSPESQVPTERSEGAGRAAAVAAQQPTERSEGAGRAAAVAAQQPNPESRIPNPESRIPIPGSTT